MITDPVKEMGKSPNSAKIARGCYHFNKQVSVTHYNFFHPENHRDNVGIRIVMNVTDMKKLMENESCRKL